MDQSANCFKEGRNILKERLLLIQREKKYSLFIILAILILPFFLNTLNAAGTDYHKATDKYPALIDDGEAAKTAGSKDDEISSVARLAFDYARDVGPISKEDLSDALDGDLISSLTSQLETAYDGLSAVGLALVSMYFIIEVIEQMGRDMMTMELFSRIVFKFAIAKTVIDNGYKLLKFAVDLSDGLTKVASNSSSQFLCNNEGFLQYISSSDLDGPINQFKAVPIFITIFVAWLFIKGTWVVANIICYARLFEIGVRAMFASIGMADIVSEGMRSHGMNYFRKFMAVCFQGSVIVVTLALSGSITAALVNQTFDSWTGAMVYYILCSFLTVALIIKSQSLANDITGAH